MRLVSTILTLSALAALILPTAALSAPGPRVEVLRQHPGGFTLRVLIPEPEQDRMVLADGRSYLRLSLPGFGPGDPSAPGHPDLPRRSFPFGLPEDAVAEMTFRVIRSETFTGPPPAPVPRRWIEPGDPFPSEARAFEPDAAVYTRGGFGADEVVSLGEVMGWRHQRIQAVTVNPIQAAPGRGEYRVARELEIEVAFRGVARAPGRPALLPAGPDAAGWDALMEDVLVNAASARSFRRRPAATAASLAGPGDGDFFRVQLAGTGLCRIPFADLEAQGWPTGVATTEVRVEERGYDRTLQDPYTVVNLPRTVEDTNQNGVFDTGDFVVFYGFNYRDRFNPNFSTDRYSYFHCYWVTHDEAGGVDFDMREGYPDGADYVEKTSFPTEEHFEQDEYYINNPPQGGSSFYPPLSSFYWFDARDVDELVRFEVFHPDPEGSYRIKARWQGIFTTLTTRVHLVSLQLNSCQILSDYLFTDRATFNYDSELLPSQGCLSTGQNRLRITGRTPSSTSISGAYFDWFELTYDRLLVAAGDAILFNSGGTRGKLEFNVTGFSSPDIDVYDVTDPLSPFKLAGQVTDAGGSYSLGLRVNVISGTRDYYAVVRTAKTGLPPTTRILPADLDARPVSSGLPRDLIAEGNGSDYILITHPQFRDAWAPLIAHREAQGHRVFLCDVWEIYDQFSGGDKSPWAIQRFLTQAFRTWTTAPSYVLLAGDASEDYRNDSSLSDPDFVPTMMHFGNVGGTNGKELVGTDNWYVAFLREGDEDWDVLPEMHIARLPVGNLEEIQIITDKILRFENEDPDAAWRNRAFLLADDQYSTSITAASGYQYNTPELTFRLTTEAVCDSIHVLGRLPDFDCRMFFLDSYLDTVEALGRTLIPGNEPDLFTTSQYTRTNVTPIVQAELSQGHLVWQFTGHANKNIITTELLMEHYPSLGIASRALDGINNLNKPFIFFGYACHLNEFEYAREKSVGDCIGEELLFAPNRGAVASFASSGYEWLPTNPDAQMYTSRAMFWNLPRDEETGRPRRILGDVITRALMANAHENGLWNDWLEMFRTYLTLGDPAMRIDISSAYLLVDVDGIRFTDGTLTADSFSDSLSVVTSLSDDVDIASIRVLEDGTELPEDRVTIVSPEPTDEGTQFYTARFKVALKLGSYDVVVEGTDWAGRISQQALPVRFETVWTSDDRSLDPGGDNILDLDSPVEVSILSPVPLEAGAFELLADGLPLAASPVALDEEGRQWKLVAQEIWQGGDHEVTLRATGGGSVVERSVGFRVSEADLSLITAYFYPNPYEEGPASLVYELTHSARRGEVSVYTVSGRRVLRSDAPVRAGRNAFHWDISDAGGDEVANGVYLFVLKIDGYEGESIRHLERVAVTR